MSDVSNDNEGDVYLPAVGRPVPDAYGQAAMLLIESLIHALVEQSVISMAAAIEIVKVATEVKEEIGGEIGDTPAVLQQSLNLLNAISLSLQIDANESS